MSPSSSLAPVGIKGPRWGSACPALRGGSTGPNVETPLCTPGALRPASSTEQPALGTPESELVNQLALAYRAGQADALPRIFEALRPVVELNLIQYGPGRRPLPAPLDPDDLAQEAWLILDTLLHQWDPAGGDFGGYARVAFPNVLMRFVRNASPRRRARGIRVDNVAHDKIVDRCNAMPGADGRRWVDQLALAELIDELDPLARRVLRLRVLEDRALGEVAHALQLSRPVTFRECRRALQCLRQQVGHDDDEPPEVLDAERAMERLVTALYAGAGPDGRLPGRAWIAGRTGLSSVRLAKLMRLLAQHGCIEGRHRRCPGRLVHPTPSETLDRVLTPPDSAPPTGS